MVNRFYQRIIAYTRSGVSHVFGVVNRDGEIVACSDEMQIGNTLNHFRPGQGLFRWDEYTCCSLDSGSAVQYAVFLKSTEINAAEEVSILASFMNMMGNENEEGDSRTAYIRRLLYDEADLSDIYIRLRELNINNSELVTDVLKVEDGFIKPNDKPGWGMDLNYDFLKEHEAIVWSRVNLNSPRAYTSDGAPHIM